MFENVLKENLEPNNIEALKRVENSNVIYPDLKISIPEEELKSSYPSPTGNY